jgi:hypothetical protein
MPIAAQHQIAVDSGEEHKYYAEYQSERRLHHFAAVA